VNPENQSIDELVAEIERPQPVRHMKYYEYINKSGQDQIVTFYGRSRPEDILKTDRRLYSKGKLGEKARQLVTRRHIDETKRKGTSDQKFLIELAEDELERKAKQAKKLAG
jgi:hypothetical protein